jgi:Fe-Mn family superoxide dismutase
MHYGRRQLLIFLGAGLGSLTLQVPSSQAQAINSYDLPPLPYDYAALEPVIDRETMMLHHDKHHAAYIMQLNKALAKHPEWQGKSIETLLRDLNQIPEDIRTVVRNNGGGHANHTLFWQIMNPPKSSNPEGMIVEGINRSFGSLAGLQDQFNQAGLSRFGSGWVWLVLTPDKQLQVTTTANQDSPLTQGLEPIFANDLWEHAYYLTYRNRRGDYLQAWWDVLNWVEVNRRYTQKVG